MQAYTENTHMKITVESLNDINPAWLELCATLAFLADGTGGKANERGLREHDGIRISRDSGDVGEIYVRAAALMRCRELAVLLSPETVIEFYEESQKSNRRKEEIDESRMKKEQGK